MTNLVFYPELFLEKVLSSSFFDDKILNNETELKSETIKILKKVRLTKDEQEGIRKILKNYKERKKQNEKNGIKDDNLNNEKLLKDRIEDYVKYNEVENLKEKYKDKYYIWLPSSALVPDPQHQLLYGKKFKVGTGDKEGNMPGERWGCMCGMKILDVDENSYGMKEDNGRETKNIDNVIDGEVAEAGNSEVDNRIINNSIVRNAISYDEMKEKKVDDNLIVVEGDELGEYRDFKELSKKTMEYYKANIQGTGITRKDIGRVEFTGEGIRETIHNAKGYIDSIKSLIVIKEIIELGDKVGEREIKKIRKDDANNFMMIAKDISLSGIIRKAFVLIKVYSNYKHYYGIYLDLHLKEKIKKD